MAPTEEVDHKLEDRDYAPMNSVGDGANLSRQVTISLSPEQYERMFFSPNGPRVNDLTKRLANPTLLGLLSFLIPYSSTIFTLIGWAGAVPPTSLVGLSGDYYFLGCIGMVTAGIAEFILGNTFPFAVFIVYGAHWGSLAYTQDPIHNTTAPFMNDGLGGATGAPYESSQAFHNVTMCLVSFVFFIGTFRVNVPFVLVFLGLIFLFAFIAAADFAAPTATTAAELAHVETLLRVGGGFGMLGVVCGWYLAILTVMEAVGIPVHLPVFDLSSKVFPAKDNSKNA